MSADTDATPEPRPDMRNHTARWLACVREAVVAAVRRGADECEIRLMYDVSRSEIVQILKDERTIALHGAGLNDREMADALCVSRLAVWFRRQRLGLSRNASRGRQRGEPEGRA